MRPFRPFVPLAALLSSVLLPACSVLTSAHPDMPCSARVCALSIQNNAGFDLAVRYADTTGRVGVLGQVAPRVVKVFRIQWIHSERLRIMVLTRDGGRFDAYVPLVAARQNEVHFPEDFTMVDADESVAQLPALPATRVAGRVAQR